MNQRYVSETRRGGFLCSEIEGKARGRKGLGVMPPLCLDSSHLWKTGYVLKFLPFVLCQRLLQLQLGTAGVGGHPHVAVVRMASAADAQFTGSAG